MRTYIGVCLCLFTSGILSQLEAQSLQNALPVVIDAQNQLECSKNQRSCKAKGGVHVQKGDAHLKAEKVKVTFSEKRQLEKATAKGNVTFEDERYNAKAKRAKYDLAKSTFDASGKTSLLDKNENRTLKGDKVNLQFFEQKDSQRLNMKDLKQARASGHVSLTTPSEYIEAVYAQYDPPHAVVTAQKNVQMVHERGIIEGDYAQAKLDQKIYRVEGKKSPDKGVVYGLIFPNKQEKK